MEKELPTQMKMALAAVSMPPPPARPATAAGELIDVPKLNDRSTASPPAKFVPLRPDSFKRTPSQEREARLRPVRPARTSDVQKGRALLRMLETGKGPSIEINWPTSTSDRARLYLLFTRCFGMETALLDDHNKLYRTNGTPGQAWLPNLDKFSSFMRKPTGELSKEENREIKKIRNHHALTGGSPVRFFPRNVDAVLLATLKHHLDDGYATSQNITASYFLNGSGITVSQIRINGRNTASSINLQPPLKCMF